MPRYFDTEVREVFGNKYLKVFVRDLDRIDKIRALLSNLTSVKSVNVTVSQSKSSPGSNLTVYPKKVYDIDEVKEQVEAYLISFFQSGPNDPVFSEEVFSSISDKAFAQIVSLFQRFGHNLEKLPRVFSKFDLEEEFRDYFIPFLNSQSIHHRATGETFNKLGKTDILIQDSVGNNVFIAEFKIWHGASELQKAADQLIEKYVNWRDEQTALVVINKNNAGFCDVITNAIEALQTHNLCKSLIAQDSESSALYEFYNSADNKKLIKLELIIFNYYSHQG